MRFLRNQIITILFILFITLLCQCQKENNGIDLINWYNNNDFFTRTVKNGNWSDDEKDAPTDKELEQILDTACKVQTAVNWNEFFFLVVRDPTEQEGIVGNHWGQGATANGTVTILILADHIANQKNHKAQYTSFYKQSVLAYFDAGMASSILALTANTLGYNTHFFGYLTGKSIPVKSGNNDFGTPNYDISKFVKGRNYMREWGLPDKTTIFEVEGNCVLIGCVVIGKPNKELDAVSSVTMHKRPGNWAIWKPIEPNQ